MQGTAHERVDLLTQRSVMGGTSLFSRFLYEVSAATASCLSGPSNLLSYDEYGGVQSLMVKVSPNAVLHYALMSSIVKQILLSATKA